MGIHIPESLQIIASTAERTCENIVVSDDLATVFGTRLWWSDIQVKLAKIQQGHGADRDALMGGVAEAIGQRVVEKTFEDFDMGDLAILKNDGSPMITMRSGVMRFDGKYNISFFPDATAARRSTRQAGEMDMTITDTKNSTLILIDFCMANAIAAEKGQEDIYTLPMIAEICKQLDMDLVKLHIALNARSTQQGDVRPQMFQGQVVENCFVTAISTREILDGLLDGVLMNAQRRDDFSQYSKLLSSGVQ